MWKKRCKFCMIWGTICVCFVLLQIGLIWSLFKSWPVGNNYIFAVPWKKMVILTEETNLLARMVLIGAIGGNIHVFLSLGQHMGKKDLRFCWIPYYLFKPLVGAGLALTFYFILRGGLMSSKATPADLNIYGFCGIAALSGLFSEIALEKLRQVLKSMLSKDNEND